MVLSKTYFKSYEIKVKNKYLANYLLNLMLISKNKLFNKVNNNQIKKLNLIKNRFSIYFFYIIS